MLPIYPTTSEVVAFLDENRDRIRLSAIIHEEFGISPYEQALLTGETIVSKTADDGLSMAFIHTPMKRGVDLRPIKL